MKTPFNPEVQSSTQKAFVDSLVKFGGKYKNFVVFNSNIGSSLNLQKFAKTYPDRYFTFGNAGRSMFGASAGFATRGKVPFIIYSASAFGCSLDLVRNFLAFGQMNVKVVGINAGLLNSPEGAINQSLEDVSAMRSIPGMKVVCPADSMEVASLMEVMMLDYGPTYLRLMHLPLPVLYSDDYKFVFGKGSIYKSGSDVCIFAYGTSVHTALDAAKILEREGKSTMVVSMSSVSPIDEDLIVECAKAVSTVVTVEDHQIVGGLGSAVSEVLSTYYPMKVLRIGMNGFSESGRIDDVFRKYGLDGVGIAERITEFRG